jgi:hypothetical protein
MLHARFVTPLVLALFSGLFFVIALTLPAWFSDARIGPGFFAQTASAAALTLSLIWLTAALIGEKWSQSDRPGLNATREQSSMDANVARVGFAPGLFLLLSVLAFILLMPKIGLVLSCGLSAGIAARGAGEVSFRAIALSAAVGGVLSALIGLALLPPAIQLWPWSPFGHG